jgi:hypothetical protein
MKQIHPHALFRLSVLGPLASRDRLDKGDPRFPEKLHKREDH